MDIRLFSYSDSDKWDDFLNSRHLGTFLHSRKFLSYHNNRFRDLSLVIYDSKGSIVGLFPAAMNPDDASCIVSHPGATYGGLISAETNASAVKELFTGIIEYYSKNGFKTLIYKSVPPHLQTYLSQIDVYELLVRGAKITRRDLWSVINLAGIRRISKGRKWGINKAIKSGVIARQNESDEAYESFHMMISELLNTKYSVKPVHSLEEMLLLRDLFPENISLWTARSSDNLMIAGTWIFRFGKCAWHTQYIGTNELGRSCHALDILIETIIQHATAGKISYISFGTSTENEGKSVNHGLLNYKTEFGAGTLVHDFYSLSLG